MENFDIKNSMVCYDDWNLKWKPDLSNFIESQDIIHLVESIPEDVILVLWWDGTMLNAIGHHHNDGRSFLGLNFGHKWFLLNHREWVTRDSGFITRKYPLLEVSQNGEQKWVWFNDVNVYSPHGKVLELDISRKDIGKIQLKWDGVLVSTPAWSTWHSRSYGSPSLPHNSNNIIITPKGNIKDEKAKIVDANGTPLIISNTWRKFAVTVNIDGNESFWSGCQEDISVEIRKIPDKVKLLISQDHEQDWDNKVMQEQGFR